MEVSLPRYVWLAQSKKQESSQAICVWAYKNRSKLLQHQFAAWRYVCLVKHKAAKCGTVGKWRVNEEADESMALERGNWSVITGRGCRSRLYWGAWFGSVVDMDCFCRLLSTSSVVRVFTSAAQLIGNIGFSVDRNPCCKFVNNVALISRSLTLAFLLEH